MKTRGFTMIELVVVIGIVLILIGLILPSINKSMTNARRTRSLVQCRQNMTLISAYANDYKDVYPLASSNISLAQRNWYQSVITWGGAKAVADLDHHAGDNGSNYSPITFSVVMGVVRDWNQMIPGQVTDGSFAVAKAIRQADVSFPSRKGVLFQYVLPYEKRVRTAQNIPMFFCCATPRKAPIAFGDGSVAAYTWKELAPENLEIDDHVGYPVQSTWYGCKGVDR